MRLLGRSERSDQLLGSEGGRNGRVRVAERRGRSRPAGRDGSAAGHRQQQRQTEPRGQRRFETPYHQFSDVCSPGRCGEAPVNTAVPCTQAAFQLHLIRVQGRQVRPLGGWAGTLPHARHRRVSHQRFGRTLLRLKTNRLSHTQPAPLLLAYDSALYLNRPDRHLSCGFSSHRHSDY